MKTWDRTQAEKMAGIPRRRILFYVESKMLTGQKAQSEGQGQGVKREYTAENILELALIGELKGAGFSLSETKKIMFSFQVVRERWWDTKSSWFKSGPFCLILTKARRGGWITGFRPGDQATVHTGQDHLTGIVINIGRLIESIDWQAE